MHVSSTVLQLSDSGIYTCVATSSSGETSWSAFLEVKGTAWHNDSMYFMYNYFFLVGSMVRESDFFLSHSIISEAGGVMVMKNHDENELPGPPSKPQVTDVTKNSVSLSWQPGMVGASPVSSFVIEAFRFVLPVTSNPLRVASSLVMLWITGANILYFTCNIL